MSEFNEPWCLDDDDRAIDSNGDYVTVQDMGYDLRVVTAINAMAGIPDPAAFVKAHRELVEAAERQCINYPSDTTPRLRSALAACAQQEKV